MQSNRQLVRDMGYAAAGAPIAATLGYGVYDAYPEEGQPINYEQMAINAAALGVPTGLAAIAGSTGYGLGALAERISGRTRPNWRKDGAAFGAAAGGIYGMTPAIGFMQNTDSITQNIPMKEAQEITDLLYANGVY